jgi:hypothetical protein
MDTNPEDENVRCDLCGEPEPQEAIYRSDDRIYLCDACLKKIEAVPEVIRGSLERILLGNVV